MLSRIVCALLVICLVLFKQCMIVKTATLDYDDSENATLANVEFEEKEESTVVAQTDMTDPENATFTTADIEGNEETTVVARTHMTDAKNGTLADYEDSTIVARNDVIELNIGGQRVTTSRATLTAVPNSKLALMFSEKTNKPNGISMDKHGAVFFDYKPSIFNHLLDQLRRIKRLPKRPACELQYTAPSADDLLDFSYMLIDLGLNPDRFLSPFKGIHTDLDLSSLVGWEQCHRSTYNTPFNLPVLTTTCNGSRLLVACQRVGKKSTLTVAAVGRHNDVLRPCQAHYCSTYDDSGLGNGVGWYYVQDQAWGFVLGAETFTANPCDTTDLNSETRLCWSLRSNVHRGGGDRCGSAKDLHNSTKWERVIYHVA